MEGSIPVPDSIKSNIIWEADYRRTRYDYCFLFGKKQYEWSSYITNEMLEDDINTEQVRLLPLKRFWRKLGAM